MCQAKCIIITALFALLCLASSLNDEAESDSIEVRTNGDSRVNNSHEPGSGVKNPPGSNTSNVKSKFPSMENMANVASKHRRNRSPTSYPFPPEPIARDRFPKFDWTKTTIFVSMPEYRDPEFNNTVIDLFDKADHPSMIHLTALMQEDDDFIRRGEESGYLPPELDQYSQNITVIAKHYKTAVGAGKARSDIQKHFKNETYYLQLDSHHR